MISAVVMAGPQRYQTGLAAFAADRRLEALASANLDEADVRIIDALLADGRAKARSMTVITGLTEETVAARLRSLLDRHVIGVSAVFDWKAAGFSWDLFVSVKAAGGLVDAVIDELARRDEVISVFGVFGPVDLVAHVLCRNREDMLEFLSNTLTRVDGIRAADVMPSLDTVKYVHQFARVPLDDASPRLPAPVVELSSLDHRIIDAVVHNGRASHREIGRDLGVADGTIRTRLRRLVSARLLKICAQVDPVTSGMIEVRAFIGIAVQGANVADVASQLALLPKVLTISITTGRFDLFCYAVASSRAQLIELVAEKIRPTLGVRAVETWEVIDVPKYDGRWSRL